MVGVAAGGGASAPSAAGGRRDRRGGRGGAGGSGGGGQGRVLVPQEGLQLRIDLGRRSGDPPLRGGGAHDLLVHQVVHQSSGEAGELVLDRVEALLGELAHEVFLSSPTPGSGGRLEGQALGLLVLREEDVLAIGQDVCVGLQGNWGPSTRATGRWGTITRSHSRAPPTTTTQRPTMAERTMTVRRSRARSRSRRERAGCGRGRPAPAPPAPVAAGVLRRRPGREREKGKRERGGAGGREGERAPPAGP